MEEKLEALIDDLMARAYDPGTHKYNLKDTNDIIREHFEKLKKEKNEGEGNE